MVMPSNNTIKMALPSRITTIKMAMSSSNNQKFSGRMANLAKLEFVALDVSGNKYLSWVLDAELHLSANGLKHTIDPEKIPTVEQNAKANIFLRHHIHEDLKSEYLTFKNPLTLWNNLKDRFDHQKLVHLSSARYDWINLRLQDFKSVSEYNYALFKISSNLILCGENITDAEMIEKTLSTFHPNTMILAQQYRERNFQKYGELISLLLVAEKNNELLLKNHQICPTGSTQLPEVHNTSFLKNECEKGHREENGVMDETVDVEISVVGFAINIIMDT
ncbi:uncharacterized protein LOC141674682 [Apium graveolens]|uniref:uncharacterized protein LOC141674682 n=1 Tax=Apium graveolens TaxID=4045 RepID=UPI003D79874F